MEPDEGAVEQIRSALEPYGFEVQSIPNGEAAVEWARHNEPTLIIVSVEPRKVGYAVCNKLKRANELQRIPLILTSAEETPQTFDQHKKLKSRADEYLLKPFTTDELLGKVGTLVHLQDPEATGRANGNRLRRRREPAGGRHLPGAVGRRQRHHGRGTPPPAGEQPVRPGQRVRRRVRPGGRRRLRRHPEPGRDRAHPDRQRPASRQHGAAAPAPRRTAPRSGTTRRPAPRS